MRVAIVNLTAGGFSGGYLKYLQKVVPRLIAHPKIEAVTVLGPDAARAQLAGESWQISTWPDTDMRRGFRLLKEAVRSFEPTVVFIPTANWLRFGNTPVVVMVRNMEPLDVPFGGNPTREALRNLGRRALARRACRRARRVIAVSQHVRQFIVSRWSISPGKVPVIYHGVDMPAPDDTVTAPEALRDARADGFLFAAGSIRPARGLQDLVDAVPHLVSIGFPSTVVIAGTADAGMFSYERRLIARAQRLGIGDRIVWAGRLNDAEMRWCYQRCTAFVMTSRAEACPNIALEAMSQGCACVSGDRAPMPEFFGDSAVYYPPGDSPALARAVKQACEPATRRTLGAAASTRARAFDWSTTVERTVAELRAAVHS